jgi:hypothetical protein
MPGGIAFAPILTLHCGVSILVAADPPVEAKRDERRALYSELACGGRGDTARDRRRDFR